jgi:hypothetical protein
VHAGLAHQQLPVSLHILNLVVVILEGSLVQLLLNPDIWGRGGGKFNKKL